MRSEPVRSSRRRESCGVPAAAMREESDGTCARSEDDPSHAKKLWSRLARRRLSALTGGKLELLPRGVRLEGRDRKQDIPYEGLSGVHVGRTAAERVNGSPSLVLERIGHLPITIATVAQSSLIGEVAERLAAFQLGAVGPRRVILVLPLKPGAQEAVRALLAQGPPFDSDQIGELDRHEVFLTSAEAIFVFESAQGADTIAALLTKPEFWQAAGAWQEHVAGPPRLAESLYSWARAAEPDELSFLPTPGPGDSDGGDIF